MATCPFERFCEKYRWHRLGDFRAANHPTRIPAPTCQVAHLRKDEQVLVPGQGIVVEQHLRNLAYNPPDFACLTDDVQARHACRGGEKRDQPLERSGLVRAAWSLQAKRLARFRRNRLLTRGGQFAKALCQRMGLKNGHRVPSPTSFLSRARR